MSVKQSINQDVINLHHFFCVCLVILMIIWVPSIAQGHKVNIFAYAEDGKIFTESYFNDGSPCKGSEIQVYDPDGNELLNGKTDEEGFFTFEIPQRTELRIVLTASMGHKAEYRMPASEISDIASQKTEEQKSQKEGGEEEKPVKIADQNIGSTPIQPAINIDMDQIRAVVEDAVDQAIEKRMKSLIHSMAKAQARGVSFHDIIGGIGYIFGLMGIVLYFKKKEK